MLVVVGRSQNTTQLRSVPLLIPTPVDVRCCDLSQYSYVRPYITLTFGGVAMARCYVQCQQRFQLSTCLSQIKITDILALFNVQSEDRNCPSARRAAVATAIRRNIQWLLSSEGIFSGYCHQREYSVATAIRGNIQWLRPSEGIFSGYCHQREYSVATAIRGNIQWLRPSEGIFSGYCHQREYSVATAIRGNIQWLRLSEGIFSGYGHQKEYSVATAIRGNIQWLRPSEGIFSGYGHQKQNLVEVYPFN